LPVYELPKGMRYSTLEERERFYRDEFDVGKIGEWFGAQTRNVIFAVIMGRHTGVYPPEYKQEASTTILIDEYNNLEDVKSQILEFRPEAVYYDRNLYDDNGKANGQELAFDVDPENLRCPIHGTLEDKMKRHQGLSFCETEFAMAKAETIRLHDELSRTFSRMKVVYSGRGLHVHVFDDDAYKWSRAQRRKFAKKTKLKGFPIDEWVTSGNMRLIRLPYSLHGMVSRIVIPVDIRELQDFDPVRDERCIPLFHLLVSQRASAKV